MTANTVKFEGALTQDTRNAINIGIGDYSLCTTAFSQATSTTLANVEGLVTERLAPGTYDFEINLITTAGASGGVKAALKQGTAGMLTSISATVTGLTAAGVANTTFTTATDAASIIAATTAYVAVRVKGIAVIGLPGTLQVQVAQNASDATATTVALRSSMVFRKIL
jgi:hypothetical protein